MWIMHSDRALRYIVIIHAAVLMIKGKMYLVKPKNKTEIFDLKLFKSTYTRIFIGPGYLQDILQNAPPNLKLEKAFNNYWSRTAPFCSLCAAFSRGKVS
jgi:hypothetical protein